MKSLDALYEEVQGSDELKKEFVTAYKECSIEDFLKNNECDASAEDVKNFMDNLKNNAVSDDDLDKVAGGCASSWTCNAETCCPSDGVSDKKLGWC